MDYEGLLQHVLAPLLVSLIGVYTATKLAQEKKTQKWSCD